MLTPELIRRFPKAELHVHLDGSLRPATLVELAGPAGVELPSRDPETVRRFMKADRVHDLEEYLKRFEYTINVLQTPENIARVAYEMCEDAARDNVRYIEIRYAPRLSTRRGLTLDEVMGAELDGLARGEQDFGVVARVINCALRHHAPEVSVAIAELSVRWRDRGVVGFDLAGGEAGRPPGVHGAAFDVALAGELGITVHAGEAAGAESIAEAIRRCHANRIGHGTRLFEDPELQDYVRDRRIALEVNLTSNEQTHAVRSVAEHPVKAYVEQGLNVTLGSDNWLMSGTDLSTEYWRAHAELGLGREVLERMILNGFESAFLPWPDRQRLAATARDELAAL
ncbi:MAG TPA: adenosine deaminase [Gemmatimonadales bacterium]|nr:adenosine deaminase [Gemmatimonadales bacterium]